MTAHASRGNLPAWRSFQNDVAQLFRVSGYDVVTDLLVGFKNVDLLVSERRLGKPHRIAVECKHWDRTLTQQDITEIYANYLSLIPASIDEILVITKLGISETASAMVLRSPHLRHLSFTELHANLMDFRTYLTTQVDQYSEDGLNRYYVPPRTEEDTDLLTVVDEWLDKTEDSHPIAILGSYGLGKTTFARHLAHKRAQLALHDATARIPIHVRLGDIANEQSLEGLLGKLFTATHYVKNYNFSTFMKLNKMGRFIMIFDGFDEMKQTLSWVDFRHNLHELNRLVGSQSKVVILGRPTAFLTDAEHDYALHGMKETGSYRVRDHEWPNYREISIAPFTKGQMEQFLPEYLKYLIDVSESDSQKEQLRHFIDYDVQRLLDAAIGDIAKRPVQLKMITEILPDFHGKLADLTVHGLYDYFIDYVIERESFKKGRRRFKTFERRSFTRDVAFWLWKSHERGVSDKSIPAEIIERFRANDEDHESITRDMVSASIMDRRVGGRLFFPHRSFQEFLVAEAIRDGVVKRNLTIAEISSALTPEVIEFLEGAIGKNGAIDTKFFSSIAAQLDGYRGSLSLMFVKLLRHQDFYRIYVSNDSPWSLILTAFAVSTDRETDKYFISKVQGALKTIRDSRSALLSLFAALIASRKWHNSLSRQSSRMVGEVIDRFIGIIESEYLRKVKKGKAKAKTKSTVPIGLIITTIESIEVSLGKRENSLVLTNLYKLIRVELFSYCYITDWDNNNQLKFADAGLPERIGEWRDGIAEELRTLVASIAQRKKELDQR
jgi:hypothetical protein